MMSIDYRVDEELTAAQYIDLLERSTLSERRPVNDPARVDRMLKGADIQVTAWEGKRLVGVSRAISDFAYCTYLSDLAVDEAYQRQGIGRELVRRTHEVAGREGSLVLLAAPAAESYYPRIGMQPHHSCWLFPGRKTD